MPDSDPYAQLLSGDEAAFTDVYTALNPPMLRLAAAITGSSATAEEVAQDTWMAVLAALDRFEGKSSFKNWVFAILSNKAKTRARRDGRNVALLLEPENHDAATNALNQRFNATEKWSNPTELWDEITPERILAGRESWQRVKDITASLPPVQQAILELMEGEKIPAAEIGMLLGLSTGNVRVHLHRARERIRQVLEQDMFGKKEK